MVFYHDVKMAIWKKNRLGIIRSAEEAASGIITIGASVWKRLGMEMARSSLSADKMKCGFCESECDTHPAHLMHAAVPALALVPVRGPLISTGRWRWTGFDRRSCYLRHAGS